MSKKFAFEAALEGELDSHLTEDVTGSRHNGKSKKAVKTTNARSPTRSSRRSCRCSA